METNWKIKVEVLGRELTLDTRPGLPAWRGVDPARRLLIETMEIGPHDRVLDMACGYGVLGIVAALLAPEGQVTLADEDTVAIECAQINLRQNKIPNAMAVLTSTYVDLPADSFDVVLLHAPSYRGNAVVAQLIASAHRLLKTGGRFYLAGAPREGMPTFQKYLENEFGTVQVAARGGGKRVLLATKQEEAAGEAEPSGPVEFVATLCGQALRFRSQPGVFSHGRVDPASRFLLDVAEVRRGDEILDLGCGYGVLGITAATLAPEGRAVLVDRSLVAVGLAKENIQINHLANAEALAGDGVEPVQGREFSLILCNPPFHAGREAGREVGEELIRDGMTVLAPGGRFYVVCNEFLPYERVMKEGLERVVEVEKREGYKVILGERGE